jgi:hypothetical protein
LTEIILVGRIDVNDRARKNLRGATLNITLENPDKNEVELVLVSKHDFDNSDSATMWGDKDTKGIYMSNAVKITGNSASFDVLEDLANGAEGFDPENVRSIILQNHGSTPVTVTLVSASCKNAVSVANCKAEYKEENNLNAWIVTAHVNNIDNAAAVLTLNKKIGSGTGDNFVCGTQGVSCDKDTKTGIATYTITDNPYIHQGEHYYFKMSASNGSVTDTKDCEVTPDPISAIRSECDVDIPSVQTGSGSVPQFQFTLNGCPKAGCKYEIRLGDKSEKGTVQSGEQIKKTFGDLNTEASPLAIDGSPYTYRVIPDGSETPFPECTASFIVTEQKSEEEEIATTCSIESANNNSLSAGAQANFTFVVNNNQDINISGRNYQLVLPNGEIISGNTGSNQSKTQSFIVPAISGDVILKVWDKTEYKESCRQSLTVSGLDITCGVSKHNWDISGESSFYTSEELYFMAKNNANVAGEITVSVLKNGTADGTGTIRNYSQWNSTKHIGKLDAGEYTYKLQYGGTDICTHTITVNNPLTCSVNSTTIGIGESFTLTTSYGGTCWNSTLSGNGISSSAQQCQSSYSIKPTGTGSYTYTYSVTNGSLGATSCSQTVTVARTKPSFRCADNLKATVNKDNNVRIKITDIAGCDNTDCSYSISGIGSTATVYTGCTNTNCALNAITNKTTTAGNSTTYTVSLTNSEGPTSHECSVEFVEGATCACTCDDCSNIILTGGGNNTNNAYSGCYYAGSGKDKFRINDPCTSIKINGTSITGTHSETELENYGVSALDGGYYIEVKHSGSTLCQYQISLTQGTPANPCGSGSGGSGSGGSGGSGGGGEGNDIELSSAGMESYASGSYTLKTTTLGGGVAPTTFKCRTIDDRPSSARTIGVLKENGNKKYDIVIPAYNDYSEGYSLESNKTYTFEVTTSISNLECGLWY